MNKIEMLPASVRDIIAKLNDDRETIFIRDNFCATLEAIRDVCDDQIKAFVKKRTKHNYETLQKKR